MNKTFKYSLIGLIASLLMALSYFTFLTDFLINKSANWADIIRTFIPVYNICLIISMRYIIVKLNGFQNFKTMFDLFIIVLIIGFLIVWIMRLEMIQTIIFKVSILVIAGFSTVWYLWFFVSLSKIHKDELIALAFIQLYGISFLICFLVRTILPELLNQDYYSRKIPFDSIELIPYIFLIIFFYKYLPISTRTNN